MSPLSNSFLDASQLERKESFYPLRVYVCDVCRLVQLAEFESPETIFSDYVYFSSYSDSWLQHSKDYAQRMIEEQELTAESLVVEVASNDGYLLQYFQNQNIPVLGIEPARNVAGVAQAAGITTVVKFFGVQTALELSNAGQQADLLIGNNVLGHVPDLNDFVAGMRLLLKPQGFITMEFPHLLRLINENQFDTIYHEHFSYWSFLAVEKVFAAHGMTIFDVEELPTHGGSLRIFAQHTADGKRPTAVRAKALREREVAAGLSQTETYLGFKDQVNAVKYELLKFLIAAKEEGKTVVGYGAPAKGNTLLNYCGVREDLLAYTVEFCSVPFRYYCSPLPNC